MRDLNRLSLYRPRSLRRLLRDLASLVPRHPRRSSEQSHPAFPSVGPTATCCFGQSFYVSRGHMHSAMGLILLSYRNEEQLESNAILPSRNMHLSYFRTMEAIIVNQDGAITVLMGKAQRLLCIERWRGRMSRLKMIGWNGSSNTRKGFEQRVQLDCAKCVSTDSWRRYLRSPM